MNPNVLSQRQRFFVFIANSACFYAVNVPVFRLLADAEHKVEQADGEFIIGNIPSTAMAVKASLPNMIAYHTAILGVRYVDLIPNLKFLQFLAYGKGVVSDRPLLLERPHDPAKQEASAALDDFHPLDEEIPEPNEGPAEAGPTAV